MEDTLRVVLSTAALKLYDCLNPCFNGRYSQSIVALFGIALSYSVLILVLMEDTLRVDNLFAMTSVSGS